MKSQFRFPEDCSEVQQTHVGSLSGTVPDSLVGTLLTLTLEDVDSLLSRGHVGTFGDVSKSSSDHSLGLFSVDLVLGSRRDSDVDLLDESPRTSTFVVLESGRSREILEVTSLELEVGNFLDEVGRETLFTLGDESTLGIGKRENDTSELDNLESGVLSDVSRSRDEGLLSLEVFTRSSLLLEEMRRDGQTSVGKSIKLKSRNLRSSPRGSTHCSRKSSVRSLVVLGLKRNETKLTLRNQ